MPPKPKRTEKVLDKLPAKCNDCQGVHAPPKAGKCTIPPPPVPKPSEKKKLSTTTKSVTGDNDEGQQYDVDLEEFVEDSGLIEDTNIQQAQSTTSKSTYVVTRTAKKAQDKIDREDSKNKNIADTSAAAADSEIRDGDQHNTNTPAGVALSAEGQYTNTTMYYSIYQGVYIISLYYILMAYS